MLCKAGTSWEWAPKQQHPVPPFDFQPGQPTQVPSPEIRQSSHIPSQQVHQRAGHRLITELDAAFALTDVLTLNFSRCHYSRLEAGSPPDRCSEDPLPQEAFSERWKVAHY